MKMVITGAKENKTLISLLYLLFYRIISISLIKLKLSFKEGNIIIIY
jgi:hypothetical protein